MFNKTWYIHVVSWSAKVLRRGVRYEGLSLSHSMYFSINMYTLWHMSWMGWGGFQVFLAPLSHCMSQLWPHNWWELTNLLFPLFLPLLGDRRISVMKSEAWCAETVLKSPSQEEKRSHLLVCRNRWLKHNKRGTPSSDFIFFEVDVTLTYSAYCC